MGTLTDIQRRHVRKRALAYVTAIKRSWHEYLSAREYWHRHGDGKKKGYTYPYCFHGTYQWTDYDNICGGCEDSFNGYNPLTFYRWAIGKAHQDYAEHVRRAEWLLSAPRLDDIPTELRRQLIDWTMQPIREKVTY